MPDWLQGGVWLKQTISALKLLIYSKHLNPEFEQDKQTSETMYIYYLKCSDGHITTLTHHGYHDSHYHTMV